MCSGFVLGFFAHSNFPLGTLYRNLTTLSAFNIFVAWIKIFKYLSFNKTMIQLSGTLSAVITFSKYNVYQLSTILSKNLFQSTKDLSGFSVMFFIIYFAFVQLGFLLFGIQVSYCFFNLFTYFHYFYNISFIYFSRFMTLEALPILYILCSG